MDGDAGDLGEAFLNEVFEGGEDVVNAGDGVIALHDAVAGDKDVVVDLADADVVAVQKFVVIARHVIEESFDGKLELTHFTDGDFRSGDMAAERFDVDVDVELVIAVAEGSDGVFEFGGLAVSFTKGEILVDLKMEFDKEIVVLLIGGDVVNGMAHALGNGANGFEEIFVVGGARLGVDDDVGGDNFAHPPLDGVGKHVYALEIRGTRHRDGGVDEVTIARPADTDALDTQDAFHTSDGVADFVLQAFGSGVEERVKSAAAELRT